MTHLNSVLLLHFEEKTGFCTYQVIYLHRLETLGLLHAVAIDASGMVDKALRDFAACSVCVNLPGISAQYYLSTYDKINFFNLLFNTNGSVKHPNFQQICRQNMSNARATKAPSGHHNYRLPTRPDDPAINKTDRPLEPLLSSL
jgi:hypothetical protein